MVLSDATDVRVEPIVPETALAAGERMPKIKHQAVSSWEFSSFQLGISSCEAAGERMPKIERPRISALHTS